MRSLRFACFVGLVVARSTALLAADIGTAFTFQGSLENPPGAPMSGTCTFAFKLCNDAVAVCAPGTVSSHPSVEVTEGVFTVPDVDFGAGAINGTARWLEITVNCGNPGDPITLAPRQELRPAPHALALPGLYTQETSDSPNIIGGLHENLVAPGVVGATISGGGALEGGINRVTDNFGAIGGGAYNSALGDGCTIGGGIDNSTSIGDGATVGGGYFNTADDYFATVGGGVSNFAGSHAATVGGGSENTASGSWSFVGGGNTNVAGGGESSIGGGGGNTSNGQFSTVPGGRSNDAGGDYSFAAGRQARANHSGAFVWADSTGSDFTSTAPDQFLIRAPGGVGIGTDAPAAQLDVNGAARATTLEIVGGSPSQQPLLAWGDNPQGQTDVPSGSFIAVSGSYYHCSAIRTEGTLVGWGGNPGASVPDGTFVAVAAGYHFSIGIRSDGTLTGWGQNNEGQIDVPSGTFMAVAVGERHGLAIRTDGTLAGWGPNHFGEIDVPPGTFVAVGAGQFYGLAIRSDGTLAGWGQNSAGQIEVPAGTYSALSAGWRHSLAIRSDDGTLVAWGLNDQGQTNVPQGTYVAVAAGVRHSLAIRNDGTLVAWGSNEFGEINVPTGTFSAIAAGANDSFAIQTDALPSNPSLRLHVDGAFKPGSNTWTVYSDRRLKRDIEPMSGALEQLLKLQGVTFFWREPASQGGITGPQMGLIADDVQRVFPQWVGRDPKGYQTLTVRGFEALTAEAMRELREEKDCEIENLKSEIEDLKKIVRELKESEKRRIDERQSVTLTPGPTP